MDESFDKERLDDLQISGLKIIQAVNGYRYSLDPVLLADFAVVGSGDRVVDLGTASGILPLLIAAGNSVGRVVGIELQESLTDRARRNVELNGLGAKVEILQVDVREVTTCRSLAAKSFDVVVMNPPYRSPRAGRVSAGDERAVCRHELNGDVEDFLRASRWLLRRGGRVNVVFLAERLPEVLAKMSAFGLEPKRLRMVHSSADRDAHLVLVEGRKGGRPGLKVLAPLYIYNEGAYSEEIRRIYSADVRAEPTID